MSRPVRIVLLAVFALFSFYFSWQFKTRYDRSMASRKTLADSELASAASTAQGPQDLAPARPQESLGWWGAGMVISLLGMGSILAFEITQFVGTRAARAYFDDTQQGPEDPDYEKAEDAYHRGDFREAIELLREYLAAKPREMHAALRIAEIYEKDLHSPLAAALEYEEILRQKLPPERWGWTAIHLCNLYTGQLHQTQKAIDLLYRIDREYGQTGAGRKARTRLEQLVEEGVIPPLPPRISEETEDEENLEPEPTPPPEAGPQLPPGFRPRA